VADGIGETLKQKAGPLPVWAWAVIGTGGVAFYLYRKNKAAAAAAQQDTSGTDQSNLGNVPISNLSTGAAPMPIQMGDTFVNVSQPPDTDNPSPGPPGAPGKPGPIGPPGPPAPKMPAPPPKPTPPAPKTTKVTVCPWPAWCGSLSGIAQHEWGNGNLWPTLYNANKGIIGSNPNKLRVGQILTIPAKPK
jgi:nucleoid-associated protein YgaU